MFINDSSWGITPVNSFIHPSLRQLVLSTTGQDVYRCRGCSLCDVQAGDQDIPLNSLVQLVLMNDDEALNCRTLWSEEVLQTARSACIRELNLESMILTLRQEALRRGYQAPSMEVLS